MLEFKNNGNDYWYLENNHDLDFSTFEQLEFSDYPLNKNAPIRIRIKSNKENFPPSGRQVDVLEFIINNQEDIIKSIFIFYKKTIFPVFNALVDISEHDIAYDIKQLNKILGIKEIGVTQRHL